MRLLINTEFPKIHTLNKELIENALIKFRESKLSPGGFAPMGK